MKRVCLVVDHPLRDLDGLVLLGAHLASRGIEVFLVPMYDKHEVWLLRPDFVLLNYLRYAHSGFVKACQAVGVDVGVVDTEGGERIDFGMFATLVEPFMPGVRLYCVWGRAQYKALEMNARRHGVVLEDTGSPRYDFAVAPWSAALPPVDAGTGPMILVNTNFRLLNSRFRTVEQEIVEVIHAGYSEATARRIIDQSREAWTAMLEAIGTLACGFPQARVVVRPHPFENPRLLEEACSQWANVQVRQEGTVFAWIHRASVIVHHNCSTAVESVMSGREPIMPDWFDAPDLYQPASAAVSHRVKSPGELEATVGRILAGEVLPESLALERVRSDTIADFFHANDGRSSERVADAIERVLTSQPPSTHGARADNFWKLVRIGRPRERLQRAAVLALGSALYRRIRDGLRRSPTRRAKHFDVAQVQGLVERLGRIEPKFSGLVVDPAARGAAAVRIASKPPSNASTD